MMGRWDYLVGGLLLKVYRTMRQLYYFFFSVLEEGCVCYNIRLSLVNMLSA